MRKMYFAMIPKKSFAEEVLTVAAIYFGVKYGAKKLLGEEKYNEYTGKIKEAITGVVSKPAEAPVFEDEFTAGASEGDKSEEDVLARIKQAAAKGVRKGVDKIFGEQPQA